MRLQKYFIIGIVISMLMAHAGQLSFAQDDEKKEDETFSAGVSETFSDNAKSKIANQVEQKCKMVPLRVRTMFSIDNFTDSLESTFLKPFADLQRTACYRNMIWESEDEMDKMMDSYAQMSYELCIQDVRADYTDSKESDEAVSDISVEQKDLLSKITALRNAISLLREYGAKGIHLVSEDLSKIYGLESFSDDLFKEIFKLTTDVNDHPYYCPYFRNANTVGWPNVTDPEPHKHYKDILSEKDKKDNKKKRKKILGECKSKLSTIKSSLDQFFAYYTVDGDVFTYVDPQAESFYPKYFTLSESQRMSVYKKLRGVEVILPFLQRRISTCADNVFSELADTVKNIFDSTVSFFEDFDKNLEEKMSKNKTEIMMQSYDKICNKFIEAQKRSGNTLRSLPYLAKIDGVVYCSRPDNTIMSPEEAYQDAKNRSLKNLPLPKGISEIVSEDMDAALSDVMSKQLEEWSRYKFSVDIIKQRAMYKAIYDNGTDGASTAVQNLMNDFINVIQTTISKDGDTLPITKAIWDTFYELQERQNCGSCSVKEGDFKINKATP